MNQIEKLKGKKLIHIATYAAPYEGNFIRSLIALELELNRLGTEVAYVFPISTGTQPWYKQFSDKHKTYLTSSDFQHSEKELYSIFTQVHPDFIHTHFDGYDIPACKACRRYKKERSKEIAQFWHLHNVKGFGLRSWHKYYWGAKFYIHYGWYGKWANIISVNDYMLKFSRHYRTLFGQRDFNHSTVIYNCLDLSRIETPDLPRRQHHPYSYLALGGRNVQKRIDLLLQAGTEIAHENADFQILITKGCDTESVVRNYFSSNIPSWCQLLEQDDNINHLFAQADCFISTSVHETFSYAICEASVYGLPVIQSDIDGTKWNNDNPSTFLFKSTNVEELYQQMLKVKNVPNHEIGSKCQLTREHNSQKYPISKWCEMVIEFYKSALK